MLNGHLDIYELSEDWTRDPFAAALEDGKVYGAGIADMKAGTAAAAAAVRRIAAGDDRLRGDVVFQGVSCHFEGGVGTRSLCAAGFVGDAAIDCEPSSNTIGIAHRGAAYLKITTRGRQAHTTYKHLGVNAIETMEPILAGLRELESALPYEPHPLLPGGPILNIGTISGGTKHNQVPDRCTVTLDIRLLPSQDPHDVKRQVEAMIERAAHDGRLSHRRRRRVQRALALRSSPPLRDRRRRADRAVARSCGTRGHVEGGRVPGRAVLVRPRCVEGVRCRRRQLRAG